MHKTQSAESGQALIVQLCLPHYRVPFFAELSRRLNDELAVVAGPWSFGKRLMSVNESPGVKRYTVNNKFILNRFAVQTLPRVVRSCPIAILEFDLRIISNLVLFVERRRRHLPVVLWGPGLSRRPDSPSWIVRVRAQMAQWADALVLYEDEGKQDFLRLGVPEEKLFVANNSIDVKAIRQFALASEVSRSNILYIGRLIPAKKADLLIQGFALARSGLPVDSHLVIIGDGSERSRLEALVQQLGLVGAVEFIGELTDEAVLACYFAQSLLCVSPGYLGLSAIHSFAHGVPLLVADREPHSPEIAVFIPGENGEFFAANDAADLASHLVGLVANPERLSAMGHNAQCLVQSKYSVQHMADVFLQAFEHAGYRR